MKSTIILAIAIIFILTAGCSDGASKPDPQSKNPELIVADPGTEMTSESDNVSESDNTPQVEQAPDDSKTTAGDGGKSIRKPISEITQQDFRDINRVQMLPNAELIKTLKINSQAFNNNPDSLKAFVDSGLLLFWPGSATTGKPVGIVTGRELKADLSEVGNLHYTKDKDGFATLNFVGLDYGRKYDGSQDTWAVRMSTFPAANLIKIPLVVGCGVDLSTIEDIETRKILVMVSQITSLIESRAIDYVQDYNILPGSFKDILTSENFLIRENVQNLANLMNHPDVEFMWGNDYDKLSYYIYLKVKDDVLIKQCCDLSNGTELAELIKRYECSYDDLNTSSPILTKENIDKLLELDDYLISSSDIPIIGK